MKLKLSFIAFEVTSDCNLLCRYCYNPWKREGEKNPGYNNYKQARRTLKQLFKKADVDQVTMTGGEPFLAERLSELVLYCRLKKKGVSIISNGNVAEQSDYKQMVDLGVSLFQFPLHSAEAGPHDAMTGVDGSWEKSLQSIKTVLNLGGRVVPVVVITKLNYLHIKETLHFLNKLGLKRVMLNRFNVGGSGIRYRELLSLSNKELLQAYSIADSTGRELGMELTSNVCTPLCIVEPGDFPNIGFTACSASVNSMPVTLDIQGNLRLCNHSPVAAGNIFTDKIEDIVESSYVKSWKNTVPDICKDCNKFDRCYGGCRAVSEQLGLGLSHADPIVIEESSSENPASGQ